MQFAFKKEIEAAGQNKQEVFISNVRTMLKEQVMISEISIWENTTKSDDKVATYALTLGMLLAEFKDAVKEGDGPRVIQVWKLLLPIFKAAKERITQFKHLLF